MEAVFVTTEVNCSPAKTPASCPIDTLIDILPYYPLQVLLLKLHFLMFNFSISSVCFSSSSGFGTIPIATALLFCPEYDGRLKF